MHQTSKQFKFRRSSSVATIKTLPLQKIQFNPSQFLVGQSKISKLPERIITRRNSQPTLPRTQKIFKDKQPKQHELSLIMKINERLSKQNKQLKKEIELYKKISKTSSKGKSYLEESSRRDLKNIVVQKINRTKCSSRLVSDSETGLYSSKQISYEFESIGQMYDKFIKRSIKPVFGQLQQQFKKFFSQIQENYIKLKYLFESIDKRQTRQNEADYGKCQNLLQSISQICQVKIQQQKSIKYPGLIQKSKSRVKVERQVSREKPVQKEDPLELLSPPQVVQRFEKYILKVQNSHQIMKLLKNNLIVRKFTRKLSEI